MPKGLILFVVLMFAACGPYTEKPEDLADTVYTNAVIWTGVESAPDAISLAVKDGKISAIGFTGMPEIPASETIDLNGQFLMPGFIDNHVHFFEGGSALASVELRDAATPAEFSRRISDFAAIKPAGRWILNGNWDHELWGGQLPDKSWIDPGTPDNPVFVIRLDGHMGLANSAALKLAGIDRDTPTPDGGTFVKDADGDPTGILKDNAMLLVSRVIPMPSQDEILETFRLAQGHALSLGLTQVHAVTAGPGETAMLDWFMLARKQDAMTLRVKVFSVIEQWQQLAGRIEKEGRGDDILGWGGVKSLIDGSLGSTTAWFYDPYTDTPDSNGFPLNDVADVSAQMRGADVAGIKLAIHAIGDQAIDGVIEAMRDIAGDDIRARRYRIEHFQPPSRAAITAAADSGIIASMQPYHAIDDGRWAEKRIGPERIKTTYAFRSILDAGGILTFGSDWPVAPLSPLDGVYAAVTRQTTDGAHPDGWQTQETGYKSG